MLHCTMIFFAAALSISAEEAPKSRTFLFSYSATVTGLEPGKKARIWLPYPSSTGGQGDSVWACESKYGNCTDFHSLFISLARSQKIPAQFEIGFPIPEKRSADEMSEVPGYHCWAKFRPQGKGWIPVDISEASKNPK